MDFQKGSIWPISWDIGQKSDFFGPRLRKFENAIFKKSIFGELFHCFGSFGLFLAAGSISGGISEGVNMADFTGKWPKIRFFGPRLREVENAIFKKSISGLLSHRFGSFGMFLTAASFSCGFSEGVDKADFMGKWRKIRIFRSSAEECRNFDFQKKHFWAFISLFWIV